MPPLSTMGVPKQVSIVFIHPGDRRGGW
jgi:hypothetical protein